MSPSEPTPEIVRGLWAHMTKVYGSDVADKSNSALMRLVRARCSCSEW